MHPIESLNLNNLKKKISNFNKTTYEIYKIIQFDFNIFVILGFEKFNSIYSVF